MPMMVPEPLFTRCMTTQLDMEDDLLLEPKSSVIESRFGTALELRMLVPAVWTEEDEEDIDLAMLDDSFGTAASTGDGIADVSMASVMTAVSTESAVKPRRRGCRGHGAKLRRKEAAIARAAARAEAAAAAEAPAAPALWCDILSDTEA
eukprot:TRINITY_DN29711_c0_g1_i1.p3 TRINITY_DN29711_c0_g1~~TRINITY_DN29711_c0_g1_i1.p3  ORF type:complete len:149 (+),score=69.71 TRINITY_DN29711_c0_g1_i1:68-514(+)